MQLTIEATGRHAGEHAARIAQEFRNSGLDAWQLARKLYRMGTGGGWKISRESKRDLERAKKLSYGVIFWVLVLELLCAEKRGENGSTVTGAQLLDLLQDRYLGK
ncbi:MAG TPA: hypothetical protein VMW24_24640 [Sedimentisphaerales bacterium]|nr:hypothetical protein [Sedimentisphaerales bacterium]